MGNYVSCTLIMPSIKYSKAARVIFPTGEIRQFRNSMNAAELMLECPNFFLVNSQSLHIGRRFSALTADEEIEFGNVYIMFPMKRVNSVVVAGDLAVFFMAANSAAKRISGGKIRILPQNSLQVAASAAATDSEIDGGREEIERFPALEFSYRTALCRSRKPMLETIKEETVF